MEHVLRNAVASETKFNKKGRRKTVTAAVAKRQAEEESMRLENTGDVLRFGVKRAWVVSNEEWEDEQ